MGPALCHLQQSLVPSRTVSKWPKFPVSIWVFTTKDRDTKTNVEHLGNIAEITKLLTPISQSRAV
jgi:hypothetical protein